jgi:hypothetical protein
MKFRSNFVLKFRCNVAADIERKVNQFPYANISYKGKSVNFCL